MIRINNVREILTFAGLGEISEVQAILYLIFRNICIDIDSDKESQFSTIQVELCSEDFRIDYINTENCFEQYYNVVLNISNIIGYYDKFSKN